MPRKPVWISRIKEITCALEDLPRPFVDRALVESLLKVGRRRAQQIMMPCITHYVGASGLADRAALIAHLQRLAEAQEALYERQRRRNFAATLGRLSQDRLEVPQLMVQAPVKVLTLELADLPRGVHLEPGRIIVDFHHPQQALEKLLALAMAISNDVDGFERQVSHGKI